MGAHFFNRCLFFQRSINEPAWIERAARTFEDMAAVARVQRPAAFRAGSGIVVFASTMTILYSAPHVGHHMDEAAPFAVLARVEAGRGMASVGS
jgi:hypothetical protein